MIETFQKCWILILLLGFLIVIFAGCKNLTDGNNCDLRTAPLAPLGYWEHSQFDSSDYCTITYTNGEHCITWLYQNDSWEKTEFWNGRK